MGLKIYQKTLLDSFESYLSRTRDMGSPADAFAESTLEHLGYAIPYCPLPGAPQTPYVCLRVPTGGGKTRLAGHAIARVNHSYLPTDFSLTLWLVPSEPIREQTLYALKTRGEALHEDLKNLFGAFHVLDINEALDVQPSTLNTANTIIVATMQSFKRDSAEGLRVRRTSGNLMSHFGDGQGSLLDVIRLRRPFIVVDEAHNQGTPLAIDTLVRMKPSCILELTATPDRISWPSNVLRSISALELQSEDMIKLPLELTVHTEWKTLLGEAIGQLNFLQGEAAKEEKETGEVIDPVVMLLQAERKDPRKETLTPEKVKQALVEDFAIPIDTIAINTGTVDEMGSKKLGDPTYPRFIITVDKLREGWDCPYAYVLFSLRNTTSATAAEQILGRVLRMPHVKRKVHGALNKSYAFVVSDALVATLETLKDGLVRNGFERQETRELISVGMNETPQDDLFASKDDIVVPLPVVNNVVVLPREAAMIALPKSIRDKIEFSPERGTLTVRSGVSADQIKKIAETWKDAAVVEEMRGALDEAQAVRLQPDVVGKSPAEMGVVARIPLLCIRQGTYFDVFDETMLLHDDWLISSFDCRLEEHEFPRDVETMRRGLLSIRESVRERGIGVKEYGTIYTDEMDQLELDLAFFGEEIGWSVDALVFWLDQNLPFPYVEQGQKVAWLNEALRILMQEREFTLKELAFRKFRLRGAIERKLTKGLELTKQNAMDRLLWDESNFAVRDEHAVTLEKARYACDYQYSGSLTLKRHFYPQIGNLKASGAEQKCAAFIANQLEGVDWWLRNVEKKQNSLWIQTASDKFYPDFVIRLQSGVTLAVEYKGQEATDDAREKNRLGKLWAARSDGKCRFVMVGGENWHLIERAAMV